MVIQIMMSANNDKLERSTHVGVRVPVCNLCVATCGNLIYLLLLPLLFKPKCQKLSETSVDEKCKSTAYEQC